MEILGYIHHILRNYKEHGKRLLFWPLGQPKNFFSSRILYSNISGIKFYSTSFAEYNLKIKQTFLHIAAINYLSNYTQIANHFFKIL